MKLRTNSYTYFHTRNDTGSVFYVGAGREFRAKSCRFRNKAWKEIAVKHGFTVHFAMTNLSEAEALSHEVFLIQCLKDLGIPLCNITKGGRGTTGLIFSDESKAKISVAHKGKIVSDETKAKMSAVRKGKWNMKSLKTERLM